MQTQACGARMVTAPVTGVVAMQVAKPGKRRRLGRQGTAECASVPGAGNASILEEEKEMRELSSLEIRGVDGGLRSVFWSAVAEVVTVASRALTTTLLMTERVGEKHFRMATLLS